MRIAFLLPKPKAPARLKLARELSARGHEVDLVVMHPNIPFPDLIPPAARLFVLNAEPDGETPSAATDHLERCIPIVPQTRKLQWLKHHIHLAGTSRWHYLIFHWGRRLRKLKEAHFVASYVSKERPDCILPSNHVSEVSTFWAMKSLPEFPPVIPTIHLDLLHGTKKTVGWYRNLLDCSAHTVTVSNGVRDGLLALISLPPGKVSTIYNAVVAPEIDERQREIPNHPWMVDDGPPVVLAVGRLDKQKDYPTLLKAFHNLTRTRKLRLIILGEGARRPEIEGLIRSLNLEDKISLPGWTDNPFAFMSRAALFVLSSEHEGLPSVLIEALTCGCPAVSTDCPSGPSEILEAGRIGPLVPVGDHAALAGAMGRVLDDPPDKEMLKQRAAFFSVDKTADAYEKLIVETVQKHRSLADTGTASERYT